MFQIIQKAFIGLISFTGSLKNEYMLLNNEQYKNRLNLIDLNSIELNRYPFMITWDKCNGSCNSVDDLSANICFPSKWNKKCKP